MGRRPTPLVDGVYPDDQRRPVDWPDHHDEPTTDLVTIRPARMRPWPLVAAVLAVIGSGVIANVMVRELGSDPAGPAAPVAPVATAATVAVPTIVPADASPSAPAVELFAPIAIEAESPGNRLTGGAGRIPCGPCPGGARVGYLGGPATVVVVAEVASAGHRTVTVTYETDGPRRLTTRLNDVVVDDRSLDGHGWDLPRTFQFLVVVPAGPVEFTFANDTGPAPDIDHVSIR